MALIRLCPSRPLNYEVRRQKDKRSEIIHVKDLKIYQEPIAWGDEDVASVEKGVGKDTTKNAKRKKVKVKIKLRIQPEHRQRWCLRQIKKAEARGDNANRERVAHQ